ncbi:diaminopimelate decarboxylase [[Bacillus] enclensis]|uniref:Diaminopimelate decarboxylase n=1 Tax=[Bacillus] enclensis TaxID=1402860 RepID=A0A0V8HH05_9BACI|nr:diaminopimelate decarboxylase [[Bacillus] enclensis]OAT80065.1 diaminopimelate decarboxylase [Bacillus sp. MKU004]QTC41349.1 diaminopimelate decarboxylase [Bacillus sp. V3]QWC23428.1 diaminopimelate decarboxylase [Bacillus haikouensis]KSU61836.1 diaminopimelate decarboxylase [[Bacillus] enclensis]MBH9967339.1 diaminopimelate decarboxylase [[Bacillus] enclensis]
MTAMTTNVQGQLEIGGVSTGELTAAYGTPLMVYDEDMIRRNARAFRESFIESGLEFQVAYASKAFMCKEMVRLAEEENLSLDVVSGGELYTALEAGFPAGRIHFHGNNKSEEELVMALEAGIGCFVVDSFLELELLHELAKEREQQVNILLRVTPGVEAHTHDYIMTGQDDSKFGFGISTGQADRAMQIALCKPHYNVLGIHSHIGSQIFELDGFQQAITVLSDFLQSVRLECEVTLPVLNIGGGFGVRYTEEDKPLPISEYVKAITDCVKESFGENGYPLPEVWVEPGRSIVAEAGTTLYKVGSKKIIPDVRTYVSVDGGMTDNLRPALYGAKYHAVLANRPNEECTELVSIAGKCCESGDMLIWDLKLPPVNFGDTLAVFSTGAYGYSMANNYNRIPRPAVVFVKDGESRVVIERETYADLVRLDR